MKDERLLFVLEAFLASLGREIERVEWNKRQEHFQAPIHNSGTCYKTDEFVMRSEYWGDDPAWLDLPNFKCEDFRAEWYKYYTRGLQCYAISVDRLSDIFLRCFNSIRESGRECHRDGSDFTTDQQ